MILQFELTIPNVGSWNGVDTGKKEGCYIYRNIDKKQAETLINKSFYYNFGDGWGANVKVTKHKKQKSEGFRGYDWMVDEILKYGKIINI